MNICVLLANDRDLHNASLADFVRRKTAAGLAVMCWRQENIATQFLKDNLGGAEAYRVLAVTGGEFRALCERLGKDPYAVPLQIN
jgi:hypothetical protein